MNRSSLKGFHIRTRLLNGIFYRTEQGTARFCRSTDGIHRQGLPSYDLFLDSLNGGIADSSRFRLAYDANFCNFL
ncbi:hypothetical protein D3C77_629340 [compost metagenome]